MRCSPTAACKAHMPAYMVPRMASTLRSGLLPRNPNGKIDRKSCSTDWLERHPA